MWAAVTQTTSRTGPNTPPSFFCPYFPVGWMEFMWIAGATRWKEIGSLNNLEDCLPHPCIQQPEMNLNSLKPLRWWGFSRLRHLNLYYHQSNIRGFSVPGWFASFATKMTQVKHCLTIFYHLHFLFIRQAFVVS